jgi:hypothetical protein
MLTRHSFAASLRHLLRQLDDTWLYQRRPCQIPCQRSPRLRRRSRTQHQPDEPSQAYLTIQDLLYPVSRHRLPHESMQVLPPSRIAKLIICMLPGHKNLECRVHSPLLPHRARNACNQSSASLKQRCRLYLWKQKMTSGVLHYEPRFSSKRLVPLVKV